MSPTGYESLAAYILTVDKMVLGFLLPIDFLLALAVLVLIAREFRLLENLALLVLLWAGFFGLTTAIFHFVLQRPVMRLEVVQYPWISAVSEWFAALFWAYSTWGG